MFHQAPIIQQYIMLHTEAPKNLYTLVFYVLIIYHFLDFPPRVMTSYNTTDVSRYPSLVQTYFGSQNFFHKAFSELKGHRNILLFSNTGNIIIF